MRVVLLGFAKTAHTFPARETSEKGSGARYKYPKLYKER
jgi:hypothetical protein